MMTQKICKKYKQKLQYGMQKSSKGLSEGGYEGRVGRERWRDIMQKVLEIMFCIVLEQAQ